MGIHEDASPKAPGEARLMFSLHTFEAGPHPAHPGFVGRFWPFATNSRLLSRSASVGQATMNCDFVSMNSKTEYYDSAKILSKWGFTDSQCHNCGISNSDINGLLMQCAKCKRAYYCSMKVRRPCRR
jgi:hypothetical protein